MFTLLTLTKVYPSFGDVPETNCTCLSHMLANYEAQQMRSFIYVQYGTISK